MLYGNGCTLFNVLTGNVMRLIVMLLFALSFFSCTTKGEFVIKGSFDNDSAKNGVIVRLCDVTGVVIDSTTVDSGSFVFRGMIDRPELRYVRLDGRNRVLVCQQGEITIRFADDYTPYVGGTELNGRLNAVNTYMRSQYRRYLSESDKAEEEFGGDTLKRVIDSIRLETRKSMDEYYGKKFDENKDNIVGGYILLKWEDMLPLERLDSLMSQLSSREAKELTPLLEARERKYNIFRSGVGQPLVDITGFSVGGDKLSLKDVVVPSKPALLYFWSSWCSKCIEESALLKVLDDNYGDSLTIVGINVSEENRSDFRAAIDLFGMSWRHIRFDDDSAIESYAVETLPFSVVLDASGRIIMRTARLEEAEKTISSLLDRPSADTTALKR